MDGLLIQFYPAQIKMSRYEDLIQKLKTSRSESFTNTQVLPNKRSGERQIFTMLNPVPLEHTAKIDLIDMESRGLASVRNPKIRPTERVGGLIKACGYKLPEKLTTDLVTEANEIDERIEIAPRDLDIRDQPDYAPGRFAHGNIHRFDQNDSFKRNYWANYHNTQDYKDLIRRADDSKPKYDLRSAVAVPTTFGDHEDQHLNVRYVMPKIYSRPEHVKVYDEMYDNDYSPYQEQNVELDEPVESEGVLTRMIDSVYNSVVGLLKLDPKQKDTPETTQNPVKTSYEQVDRVNTDSRVKTTTSFRSGRPVSEERGMHVESMIVSPDLATVKIKAVNNVTGRSFDVQLDLSEEPEIMAQLEQSMRMKDTSKAIETIEVHIQDSMEQLAQLSHTVNLKDTIKIEPKYGMEEYYPDKYIVQSEKAKVKNDIKPEININNEQDSKLTQSRVEKNVESKNPIGMTDVIQKRTKHRWHTPASLAGI